MIRSLALFVLIALAAPWLQAQQELVLTAETSEFDGKTKENVLRGNARATDGITLITADEIRQNSETATITAIGHAVFTRLEIRLLADKIVIRQRDQSFTAERVRFGAHPYYADVLTRL